MNDQDIAAAKARMYEKYAHKRFTVTEEEGGHCWGIMQERQGCLRSHRQEYRNSRTHFARLRVLRRRKSMRR